MPTRDSFAKRKPPRKSASWSGFEAPKVRLQCRGGDIGTARRQHPCEIHTVGRYCYREQMTRCCQNDNPNVFARMVGCVFCCCFGDFFSFGDDRYGAVTEVAPLPGVPWYFCSSCGSSSSGCRSRGGGTHLHFSVGFAGRSREGSSKESAVQSPSHTIPGNMRTRNQAAPAQQFRGGSSTPHVMYVRTLEGA